MFIKSLLDEFTEDISDTLLYLCGDSGFVFPDLCEILEDQDCNAVIWLKENEKLRELAEMEDKDLYHVTKFNQIDYAVEYDEFMDLDSLMKSSMFPLLQ